MYQAIAGLRSSGPQVSARGSNQRGGQRKKADGATPTLGEDGNTKGKSSDKDQSCPQKDSETSRSPGNRRKKERVDSPNNRNNQRKQRERSRSPVSRESSQRRPKKQILNCDSPAEPPLVTNPVRAINILHASRPPILVLRNLVEGTSAPDVRVSTTLSY